MINVRLAWSGRHRWKRLLAQISSCDPLFTTGSAPSDCGAVTFVGTRKRSALTGTILPLPWNSVYQAAWGAFLTNPSRRIEARRHDKLNCLLSRGRRQEGIVQMTPIVAIVGWLSLVLVRSQSYL